MDREIKRRMMREFTVSSDLSTSQGMAFSDKFEKEVMKLLKPLADELGILRRTVYSDNGKMRNTTFAFTGPQSVINNLKAQLAEIHSALGMKKDESINIGNVRSTAYSQVTERPLNARSTAAMREYVRSAGGTSHVDKSTGIVQYMVPSSASKGLYSVMNAGDRQVLAGESAAAMGYASGANMSEKAASEFARRRRKAVEVAKLKESYELAHPEAVTDLKMKPFRTPFEQEYLKISQHELNTRMREKAEIAYAKKYPNSAIAKKLAAEDAASKESLLPGGGDGAGGGAAKLAASVALSTLKTVISLLGAGLVVSGKILSGVLETAKGTTKMAMDSAKYNLTTPEFATMTAIARGMRLDKVGYDPFSQAMGTLLDSFAHVDSAGFESALKEVGKFYQSGDDVRKFVNMAAGGAGNAKDLLMETLAGAINVTSRGRGGIMTRQSIEEAAADNLLVARRIGGTGTEMLLNAIFAHMRDNGGISANQNWTGAELYKWLVNTFSTKVVKQGDVGQQSSNEAGKKITEGGAFFESVKDLAFNKLLGLVEQIVVMLKNFLRPIMAKIDPMQEVLNNNRYVQENLKRQAELTATVGLYRPNTPRGVDNSTFERRLSDTVKYISENESGMVAGGRLAEYYAEVQKRLGTGINAKDFLYTHRPYITSIIALSKLKTSLGSGVEGFGGKLEGATPEMSGMGIGQLAESTQAALQAMDNAEALITTSNTTVPKARPNDAIAAQNRVLLLLAKKYPKNAALQALVRALSLGDAGVLPTILETTAQMREHVDAGRFGVKDITDIYALVDRSITGMTDAYDQPYRTEDALPIKTQLDALARSIQQPDFSASGLKRLAARHTRDSSIAYGQILDQQMYRAAADAAVKLGGDLTMQEYRDSANIKISRDKGGWLGFEVVVKDDKLRDLVRAGGKFDSAGNNLSIESATGDGGSIQNIVYKPEVTGASALSAPSK